MHIFKMSNIGKGSFTNYVDKTRNAYGTGDINGTQTFSYKSKGIPSQMSTRGKYVGC